MTRFLSFLSAVLFSIVATTTLAHADENNPPVKDGDAIVVNGKTYKVRVMEPDAYRRDVEAQQKAAEALAKKEKEAADRAVRGPYHGFYRETKYGLGMPFVGIYYQTKRDNANNFYFPALRVTKSFYGYHNDRLALLNASLSLVASSNTGIGDPDFSLGLGIAPVGIRLSGHKKLERTEYERESAIYLLPTYTYLIGLNERTIHQHAFGAELTFIFR